MKLNLLLASLLFLFDTSIQYNIPIRSQMKWKSDSHGRKIRKEEERQFDEKRNLVKWIQFTSGGSICEEFKYEYEGKGKIKEYRISCLQDYSQAEIKTFKYGINDRIEEELVFKNDKLTLTSIFKFKQSGDKFPYLKEDYFVGDVKPATVTNLTYDKHGNVMEERQLGSGRGFRIHTYKFNSAGQMIYQTALVDGGKGLIEYFYIFDNKVLSRDSVRTPGSETECHVYETQVLSTAIK